MKNHLPFFFKNIFENNVTEYHRLFVNIFLSQFGFCVRCHCHRKYFVESFIISNKSLPKEKNELQKMRTNKVDKCHTLLTIIKRKYFDFICSDWDFEMFKIDKFIQSYFIRTFFCSCKVRCDSMILYTVTAQNNRNKLITILLALHMVVQTGSGTNCVMLSCIECKRVAAPGSFN